MATARLKATSGGWTHRTVATVSGRRRSSGDVDQGLQAFLKTLAATGNVDLLESGEANTTALRRGTMSTALTLETTAEMGEQLIVMARHASGAITFHVGDEVASGRRGRSSGRRRSLRFTIHTQGVAGGAGSRRGLLGRVLKTFLFKVVNKVAGKVTDFFLEKLAARWEKQAWAKAQHPRLGWVAVSKADLAKEKSLLPALDMSRISTDPARRNLLFIHGTFSSTEGAFKHLASTHGSNGADVFAQLEAIYQDRLFGFNHFTISETPEDNAKRLLADLPAQGATFDVVTHSRGALVLRTLAELGPQLGPEAARFRVGKVIFVAATNDGTTLASPARWAECTTWFANIMEVFPDNPFTTFASFLGESLGWLAQHVAGALPGLAAMDPHGPTIQALQAGSTITPNSYLALASNFEPGPWLARMADAGVDTFYAEANDLVVPTDSGWRVDPGGNQVINAQQIGCYGPGGNIATSPDETVHHINFFSQRSTVDFLSRVLLGNPLGLPALDPATTLPYRGSRRSGAVAILAGLTRTSPPAPTPRLAPAPVIAQVEPNGYRASPADEMFELFVLSTSLEKEEPDSRSLVASFRNARVVVDYRSRGGDIGGRWQTIIRYHERIKDYIDGKAGVTSLPSNREMIEFGKALFEALFPGDVRRLYDAARAELGRRRLNISFTSMVPWISDKPWEFAYDPTRGTFICAEEVNLVRNVLTAVPADAIAPRNGLLRILVVAAQPVGLIALAADDEIEVIHRAFRFLEDRGLATVEVIRATTPAALHRRLEQADFVDDEIDIVHFIGHGAYDRDTQRGLLFFEDGRGAVQELDAETFRQIVCRRGVRLVFLNACETGVGYAGAGNSSSRQELNFTNGVAPNLVAGGVPAVVANQYKVLDVSATGFAENFYLMLARGRSIGMAAREARISSKYLVSGESIDWAVPVLFARNPDDVLTVPQGNVTLPSEAIKPLRAAAPHRSRPGEPRRERIGIWDVNRILPDLEGMIKRLNDCQMAYAFQAVDMAAPIGTWRAVRYKGEETGFLIAEQVEKRLSKVPMNLGLDQLLCVTELPLAGDDVLNLYGYYNPVSKIGFFSVAGFIDDLLDGELTIARAITNGMVAGLSGLSIHKAGPKNCPQYFNAERNVRSIAGKLSFCQACAKRLQQSKARNEIEKQAVRDLLAAF